MPSTVLILEVQNSQPHRPSFQPSGQNSDGVKSVPSHTDEEARKERHGAVQLRERDQPGLWAVSRGRGIPFPHSSASREWPQEFPSSFAAFEKEMDPPLLSFLVLEGGELTGVRKTIALCLLWGLSSIHVINRELPRPGCDLGTASYRRCSWWDSP